MILIQKYWNRFIRNRNIFTNRMSIVCSCGSVLLAYSVSILGSFHRNRILMSFREVICLLKRWHFPATLAISSGHISKCKWSAVWNVKKVFSKGADSADTLPFVPSFSLLLGNCTWWLKAEQLPYDLEKQELFCKNHGAERRKVAGFLKPMESPFQSWYNWLVWTDSR